MIFAIRIPLPQRDISHGAVATPFPEPCGTIYKCGTNGNFTETVAAIPNTSGYAGYRVGFGHGGMTISCCPGAGINGEIGFEMPGTVPVVVGNRFVVVHSRTGVNGIAACYAQSNDPFIEPSGTFVYDQDCRYQS